MTRGEVRWYEFQPPDKRRPVLILTRSAVIPFLHDVTIAPITSTIRGIPSEVKLGVEDGMANDCAVNFHHVQTVAKNKLGRRITTLSPEKMQAVDRAMCFALGANEDKPADA